MNQQIFNFLDETYPDYDSFLGESNQELLFALKNNQSFLTYVWGDDGSGKSHLLKAWVANALRQGYSAAYIAAHNEALLIELQEQTVDYLAIDDIHLLSTSAQIKFFDIFNDIHYRQSFLLVSANIPPAQLHILKDLRTRMGLCLVYQVNPLMDHEKKTALKDFAQARQIYLNDEILNYLLLHGSRDLSSLLETILRLDQYAVQQKRKITIPLLKQLLQRKINE